MSLRLRLLPALREVLILCQLLTWVKRSMAFFYWILKDKCSGEEVYCYLVNAEFVPLTHCTGHGQTWFTNGVHPAQMGLTHKKGALSKEQSGKHWQATSGPKARSRFSKCSPRMFPHLCNTGCFMFCELPTTSGFHISSCPLWFVFSILFLFCFWTSHKFQFSHLFFMFYCFI